MIPTLLKELTDILESVQSDFLRDNKYGVTFTEYRVLKIIYEYNNKYDTHIIMSQITKKMNMVPGSITVIIDHLESKGLVGRVIEKDRRAKKILLTIKGNKLISELAPFFTAGNNNWINSKLTPVEVGILIKLLEKLKSEKDNG